MPEGALTSFRPTVCDAYIAILCVSGAVTLASQFTVSNAQNI